LSFGFDFGFRLGFSCIFVLYHNEQSFFIEMHLHMHKCTTMSFSTVQYNNFSFFFLSFYLSNLNMHFTVVNNLKPIMHIKWKWGLYRITSYDTKHVFF